MEMTEHAASCPHRVDTVWAALNDPAMLQATAFPAANRSSRDGDNAYRRRDGRARRTGAARNSAGRMHARRHRSRRRSYTLTFEGQGGAAGFAKGEAQGRRSRRRERRATTLSLHGEGAGRRQARADRLAAVDGAAAKLADDFFARFVDARRGEAGAGGGGGRRRVAAASRRGAATMRVSAAARRRDRRRRSRSTAWLQPAVEWRSQPDRAREAPHGQRRSRSPEAQRRVARRRPARAARHRRQDVGQLAAARRARCSPCATTATSSARCRAAASRTTSSSASRREGHDRDALRGVTYGVSADEARRFGLPCGGTIQLVLEPLTRDVGHSRAAARDRGAASWSRARLDLATGDVDARIRRARPTASRSTATVLTTDPRPALPDARDRRVAAVEVSGADRRRPRLPGDVCDPREEYTETWDIPGVTLVRTMPDDTVLAMKLDERCAVVALTHDPKLDDLALMEALKSPAFYVGALGSRANNAKRRERLKEFDLTRGRDRATARADRPLHRQPHAAGDRDLDPRRDHRGEERRCAARARDHRRREGEAGAVGRLRDGIAGPVTGRLGEQRRIRRLVDRDHHAARLDQHLRRLANGKGELLGRGGADDGDDFESRRDRDRHLAADGSFDDLLDGSGEVIASACFHVDSVVDRFVTLHVAQAAVRNPLLGRSAAARDGAQQRF